MNSVQQALRAYQREFPGISGCVNRHAGALEVHHESFYNSLMTFKDINKKIEEIEMEVKFDLAKLYAAVAPMESHSI